MAGWNLGPKIAKEMLVRGLCVKHQRFVTLDALPHRELVDRFGHVFEGSHRRGILMKLEKRDLAATHVCVVSPAK